MTSKEYLNQYIIANRRINMLCEELSNLRALTTKVTSALSGDRVQTSHSGDNLSGTIAKIVDMEKELDTEIDSLEKIKLKVILAIRQVKHPVQRNVLYYRYIVGMTWESIAVQMNYSYIHICRLHGQALNKITIRDKML